jgi:ATP-binding cassette subfamily B protein
VFIFNGTIRENLVLWDDSIEHDEIVKAAEDAQILSLILSHKDGFDRVLKDNGSDLSGGERQRLELCRALIRKPNILLLDEATSALDNLTQLKFLKALRKRKITVISIDHRLEASLTSDVVVVMEQGAIVETGAPNDLLLSGGHFSKLHAISTNKEASS